MNEQFIKLQQEIEHAEQNNMPIKQLVIQQIQLLKDAHESFLKLAKKQGLDIEHDTRIIETEIQQFFAMRELAIKAKLSIDEYNELIKQARIRQFGKESYELFLINEKL